MPLDSQGIIPRDGKCWRAGNGASMRRRFQTGQILLRGKRIKVYVGRYYEPQIRNGKTARVRRSVILGQCSEITKSQARRRLREILRPLNDGLYSPMQSMSFQDFCGQWERNVLSNRRESTQAFYRATLHRWVIPHFGNCQLADIKPPQVQAFVNGFGHYSQSVIRHVRATLSRVFSTAVRWGYISSNPASGLELPPGKPIKQTRTLAPQEVRRIVQSLEEPYRTMTVIMAGTAIRESELLALKWEDFDQANHVIHIRRSVYRGKVDAPKSRKGQRDIPYGPHVADAVAGLARSQHNRGSFLFLTESNKLYQPTRVERQAFKPIARALQIAPFTWRSFRRTGATTLHASGVPLKVQQEILGHANPDTSLLYTETDIATRRNAIELLEQTVLGPSIRTLIGPKLTVQHSSGMVN